MQGSQIQLDSGQKIQLTGGQNNVYKGTVKMEQDGVYHVAGIAEGQPVRVSEDFFIEARKANPPQIALVRPGRGDYHASPIEEVTIAAKATDEYPLNGVTLHYSVNGGPETAIDLQKQKGGKEVDGSTTISLESFKLVPGDLVSVYATAKDANAEARTDMIFIQADPFEREFSQSQQGGGGGGGGGGGQANDPAQISQREKEIISQTFKQEADKNSTAQQAAEISKLLSQAQATLRDQSVKLSDRLQARELTEEMKAIGSFQKDMDLRFGSDVSGRAATAAAEVERRPPQRAEGAAIPAARRSHVPADSGRVRTKAAVAVVVAARRAIWPRFSILSSIPRRISMRRARPLLPRKSRRPSSWPMR